MGNKNGKNCVRILVADDEKVIRKLFENTFLQVESTNQKSEQSVNGETDTASANIENVQVTTCSSGEDAVERTKTGLKDSEPFAVAFLDIAMPPGNGGIWAAKEIRRLDPNINIIIVTGNLDIDTSAIVKEILPPDKLLFIQKPFYPQEITQLADSFGSKYKVEKALQQAYHELEDRVKERTADLELTNEKLKNEIADREKIEQKLRDAKELAESADKAKSHFLSNMSHEIRTPLNGVIGMADLLKEIVQDQQQGQYIDVILNSSKNLLNVINQVLEYSRIESGALEFDCITFGVTACLESTVDMVCEEAHRKSLELATWVMPDVPQFFKGDPVRFRQVLSNFLNNAIKFSDNGQILIIVSLENQTKETSTIRVKISDTGIGINKEDAEKLFRPFSQLDDSSTRSYGGIGLSLAMNKRLVKMMGGEIGVTLDDQSGATFWFTLVLKRELGLDAKESPRLPDYKGCRALVIEGNPVIQEVYVGQLKGYGFSCEGTSSSEEALKKLQKNSDPALGYELLIIDLTLPASELAEIYHEIAQNTETASIPKIFLTNSDTEVNAPTDVDLNSAIIVPKPVKEYYLLQAIGRLLKPREK